MKIAYIIPKPANTGPILVVLELVKQMLEHKHKCTVFYFDPSDEIKFPCPCIKISFFQKINFKEFDIIHSHGLRPDIYIFIHKPFKCNSLFITTLHNYIIPDFSYQYNKFIAYTIGNLWMLILNRHDKIVTLSKDAVKYYKKRLPQKKLTYVYNTRNIVNTPLSANEKEVITQFKKGFILIGINAALTDRKGIDQVIFALKKLPKHKLVIIGNGKSKHKLEQLCISENITNKVLFLGYKKDAFRYLPYYDIFALPSRNEGFGLTLIESAIFKKNVVCSDIPIFRELCPNHEVEFFQLENTQSLCNAILQATTNKNLGDKLYQRYISAFSPEIFYNNYYSIYSTNYKTNPI